MTDAADQAAFLAQDDVDQGVSVARNQVPDPSEVGPPFCPVCEEPIPDGRRNLGYKRCVECAECAE